MLRNENLIFMVGLLALTVAVFAADSARADEMLIFEDAGVKFGDATWWYTAAVAVGDVDNDGDLDVGLGNHCHYDSIYLNLGNNEFVMGSYPIGGWGNPDVAVFADMDGDGDLDFLSGTSNPLYTGPLVISVNDGMGRFTTGPYLPLFRRSYACAVGDFTGDGLPDVVANEVLVVNEGGLNFREVPSEVLCTDAIWSMAAADVDGDGDLDVASSYWIWLNDGLGNLTSPYSIIPCPGSGWVLSGHTFADFNKDGSPDLAVFERCGYMAGVNRQLILFNDGSGNFRLVQEWARKNEDVITFATGDFDNDGWVDLVAVCWPPAINVYLNDGTGVMRGPVQTLDMVSCQVAVGDMDNDGWLDLVVPQFDRDRTNHLWLNVLGKYDTTPPKTSLDEPNPSTLWPPNHKSAAVNIGGSVVDEGSGVASAWVEVDDEYDELDATYDIVELLDENGNFQITLNLIAWRDGNDRDGRKYTITLHAVDKMGNEAEPVGVTAVVPHDQRKK